MSLRALATFAFGAASALAADVRIALDGSSVGAEVADFVAGLSKAAIEDHGKFFIALSSESEPRMPGSMSTMLNDAMGGRTDIEWDKWEVFFTEDKFMPEKLVWGGGGGELSADDRKLQFTWGKSESKFLGLVGVPPKNIHKMTDGVSVDIASGLYEKEMKKAFGVTDEIPEFDLILLGVEKEGSAAALAPGHATLESTTKLVESVSDFPTPPVKRITFTLPLMNNAKKVAFIAVGDRQAEIVGKILKNEDPTLPAAMVKTSSEVTWFLARKSATDLEEHEL